MRYIICLILGLAIQLSAAAANGCIGLANTTWSGKMNFKGLSQAVTLNISNVAPMVYRSQTMGYAITGTVRVVNNGKTTLYNLNAGQSSCVLTGDNEGAPNSIYLTLVATNAFEIWTDGQQKTPFKAMPMQTSQFNNGAYINFKGTLRR